jgi:hypothetical protein
MSNTPYPPRKFLPPNYITSDLLSESLRNQIENSVLNPTNKITYEINDRDVVQTYYPIAIINSNEIGNQTITYTINLPENEQTLSVPEYVFTMRISCDFTEFNIAPTDISPTPITNDIYTADSYFFKSHFVNDTMWTPEILPQNAYIPTIEPFLPTCYKSNASSGIQKTTFEISYVPSNLTFQIKVILLPKTYVVGTFDILFGDIYPSFKQLYRDFNFTIQRS